MSVGYLKPICISKFYIYDIFYNDACQLVVITAPEINPYVIYYAESDTNFISLNVYTCPHDHTRVYTLDIDIDYSRNITLKINDEIVETRVNRYPTFKNEIIYSTEVKDEDKYIKQWIDFHVKLGVTRFIIYDNSKSCTLPALLSTYIENRIVVLIEWGYPLFLPKSGRSGQTTQQNHSIYAFRESKYIGLFDIDEYVNIQNKTDIPSFFEEFIANEKVNVDDIGSFRILNKFFYNPHNLPTDGEKFFKIVNCDKITKVGREKNFVIPKNVNTFSVHLITDGKPMITVDETKIYFNHYYFLNKPGRGRDKTNLIDTSILPLSP